LVESAIFVQVAFIVQKTVDNHDGGIVKTKVIPRGNYPAKNRVVHRGLFAAGIWREMVRIHGKAGIASKGH
jgi:hypothetical protein